MGLQNIRKGSSEDFELITNYDLIACANELLGGIQLDPASSKVANDHVNADNFFTPLDDGLNAQQWFGSVYLFPPHGAYFWDAKNERWKLTRASSPSLTSSHAVWFRKLYKSWWSGEIEQGLYFSNCPDMFRYEQKLFDFPVCILKTAPSLLKNTSKGIAYHRTCTSFLVYLQPKDSCAEATEKFIKIYSTRGRVLA
jgi:hypothetical protein